MALTKIGTTGISNNLDVPGYLYLSGDNKELRFYNGANYMVLKASGSLGQNYTLTLPVDDGTTGQFLKTDGGGVLSWSDVSGAILTDDTVTEAKLDISNGPQNGYFLQTNGSGVLTWAAASGGGGGVDTTGTPASNHIAIFHDDDTLKSTANFTFDNWPVVKRAGGTGETMGLNGFNTANYPTQLVIRKSQSNTIDTYAQVDSDQTVGGIRFEGATNSNSWKPCAELRVDTDGDAFTNSTSPGMMRIFTTPSGGVEPLARFVVRQDGKIGMGANNPNGQLSIGSGNAIGSITAPAIQIGQDNSTTFRLGIYTSEEGGHLHNNNGNNGILLESRDVEVARFWASGSNRHVGFGGITTPNDTMFKIEYNAQSWVTNFTNSHGSGSNHVNQWNFSGFSPDNDGNNLYLYCADTTAARFKIMSNGDYWSSDGGSVNSDATLKNNITDASSKLADVLNLKVRNFYWNEDVHPNADINQKKMIGFIAQEFEEVFPGLVSETEFIYDTGITKKSIKTTALIPILVKAVQELNAKVTALGG